MSRRALIVDGFDLSTIGFILSKPDGQRDGLDADWPSVKVPGRIGVSVTADEPSFEPRTIRVDGVLESDPTVDTVADLLARLDEFKYRLGSTERNFRFVDDETYDYRARALRVRHPPIDPALIQTAVRVRADLWMRDPRRYSTTQTVVSGITTATALPLGTAPVRGVIVVTGATGFTLTYKHFDTTTLKALIIAGATSPVTIDMELGKITDGGGPAADTLDHDSDFPFDFDSEDGDWTASQWPTLEVSAGSAQASYYRAWR